MTSRRIIAAYLLDRADQYDTESPCWIALADAASSIMNGEADRANEHGEFDASLLKRVDGFRRATPKPVVPNAGVEP